MSAVTAPAAERGCPAQPDVAPSPLGRGVDGWCREGVLEVTGDGDLIGAQYLGALIADVLKLNGDVPPGNQVASGDVAVG